MSNIISNPQSFKRDCLRNQISLDLLVEAKLCIGAEALARCFEGKCHRGGGLALSSAQLDTWISSLEFVRDNPDVQDTDPYRPRDVKPKQEWFDFIEIVKKPIDPIIRQNWAGFSKTLLGKEAPKYGMSLGVANNKALKTIHERMDAMYERRSKNFWNGTFIEIISEEDEKIDYRLSNIFTVREACKARGINFLHLNKEEMIDLLEEYERPTILCIMTYQEMTLAQLKRVAKDKGLLEYNNLQREMLLEKLKEHDEEEKKREVEKDKLTLCGIDIAVRHEDGYINATQICQAGSRDFKTWRRSNKTDEFLRVLSESVHECTERLIQTISTGPNGQRGTWVHSKVAIHIAQWVSAEFSVRVSTWIDELLRNGTVKIDRPLGVLTSMSDNDIESKTLEQELEPKIGRFTNCVSLYIAYIGQGMCKVGYTDCNLIQRLKRHTGSESPYAQWRLISLFEISGRPAEKLTHEYLSPHKATFQNQKEIYRVDGKLCDFIGMVGTFLAENDVKMTVKTLKRKIGDLEKENLELKLYIATTNLHV